MKIINTHLKDLLIIDPTVFNDERGLFYESYNKKTLGEHIENINFVQDNISHSHKNILRGLHFQSPPYAQAKLVYVLQGAVLDVAVDLRKKSPTYGQYFSIELNAKNNKQLYVPRGFAHGFLSLEDNTIFAYKCDNFYHKESEQSLHWNDSSLNINWNTTNPITSEKDKNISLKFIDFDSPF